MKITKLLLATIARKRPLAYIRKYRVTTLRPRIYINKAFSNCKW